MAEARRTYVLDTNVLIHDPTALFRFAEHALFIPMIVLEELDATKKGMSEVARNARQASRFLDEIIAEADAAAIAAGLPLEAHANGGGGAGQRPSGKLFLQTRPLEVAGLTGMAGKSPDNTILQTGLALRAEGGWGDVVLVSKDINLRIKARVLGMPAEDYYNDKVLDDIDLLYTGAQEMPADFWARCQNDVKCWKDESGTYYSIPQGVVTPAIPNEFVYVPGDEQLELAVVREEADRLVLRQIRDYRQARLAVWGISARNREQNFALNLLMDPECEFVSLVGTAGSGKTLLALAAGLAQCMETRRYREIVITRVTIPVGEDIGFLPGTEEEKMTPWMGALMDNLEVLSESEEGGEWGRAASADLISHRIKIRSLNFMRGRTFLNRYVIIDEAQNLTPKQMKTLITRAGPGTKFVCLGNIGQIDTPYLSETTSGLTYVVDRFKSWAHSGHVTLRRGERSRLADHASQVL
ncbi:MAG: PhoH family protein [Gammaproteobacteria bacterium]|nr:PhoH family protein [Gammaproteobacteria bacterium]